MKVTEYATGNATSKLTVFQAFASAVVIFYVGMQPNAPVERRRPHLLTFTAASVPPSAPTGCYPSTASIYSKQTDIFHLATFYIRQLATLHEFHLKPLAIYHQVR